MPTEGLQMSATTYRPGWIRLRVAGELDLATASMFASRLGDELDAHDGVLVDFGALDFIDSTGLGQVMAAVKRSVETDRMLEFAQPLPPQPRQLLEMSGLMSRITLHPV